MSSHREDWFLSKHKTWKAGLLVSEVPGLLKAYLKKSLLKLQSSFFVGRSSSLKLSQSLFPEVSH